MYLFTFQYIKEHFRNVIVLVYLNNENNFHRNEFEIKNLTFFAVKTIYNLKCLILQI